MRVLGTTNLPQMASRGWIVGFILLSVMSYAGCGETYRPVAQPIEGIQPSPAEAHSIFAVNTDGIGDSHRGNGSASDIDASGDSVQGNLIVGTAPVHAALTPNGAALYVVNSAEDTVTANHPSAPTTVAATVSLPPSPAAQITQVSGNGSTATYSYSGGTSLFSVGDTVYVAGCSTAGFNGVFTVSGASATSFSVANSTAGADNPEPPSALAKIPNAVFANTTDNNNMYVAAYGTNSVSVINTNTNVVSVTIPVGAHPVSLAEIPNNQKVYVANRGSSAAAGSVSVIDTTSGVVSKTLCLAGGSPCAFGPAPVWVTARSDGGQVFVLDANGTIYVIDTASDTVLNSSLSAGAGANFMFFDPNFSRLFVTNPIAGTLSIFDVAGPTPTTRPGTPIAISAASSSCATAVVPQSVTVLGDGTKAYVASYQLSAGTICTQASVIDAGSGTLLKTIPLTQSTDTSAQTGCGSIGFRAFAASSGGGTNSRFKVYVSQCDAGNIAVINTYPVNNNPADTYSGVQVSGPLSTFPPLTTGIPPSQNPVFLVGGP